MIYLNLLGLDTMNIFQSVIYEDCLKNKNVFYIKKMTQLTANFLKLRMHKVYYHRAVVNK